MGFECFGYVGGSPLIASNQSLEWVNERLGLVCLQLEIAGLISSQASATMSRLSVEAPVPQLFVRRIEMVVSSGLGLLSAFLKSQSLQRGRLGHISVLNVMVCAAGVLFWRWSGTLEGVHPQVLRRRGARR